jgi:Fe-S cluster assembly protein SufD
MRIVEDPEGDRDLEIRLKIGEGAHVVYVTSANSPVEFVRREARLAKNAKLEWVAVCPAPAFPRDLFVPRHEGVGGEVDATSLVRGTNRQRFDMKHEIIHAAPRTVSNLRVGSVLSGDAKAIVRGLVRVEKNAPGCVSRQKEETLLLSDSAEIDAVPMLEIENQDVRCSHAATVGRIDEEKMFYLMSRGLDRSSAEAMLIDAFIEPYLSKTRRS